MKEKMRIEKDSLGELSVPDQAHYGIQTQRAVQNFPISGMKNSPALVDAVMSIKKAAAVVNSQLGLLDKAKAAAIVRACEELLGGRKGEYERIHPNDHVNMGQSTNDVFPTAMRISTLRLLQDILYESLGKMAAALDRQAVEFDGIIKSGRTHLQDAAPIRLGQEFKAYSLALKKSGLFLKKAAKSLLELGIGGSAVGTGLNTIIDRVSFD